MQNDAYEAVMKEGVFRDLMNDEEAAARMKLLLKEEDEDEKYK